MLAVFTQIFPFFALVALGYIAARSKFFSEVATGNITAFVFYFALPAMLFRFAADLKISEVIDPSFVLAYWLSVILLYTIVMLVARFRHVDQATAAIEAQCGVFGNSGFMAIPIMIGIFGERAVGPLIMILAVDTLFTSNMAVITITAAREGKLSPRVFKAIIVGLFKNPMFLSIALGLILSVLNVPEFTPVDKTLEMLGAAATPAALFVIGASLAQNKAEKVQIALWLSFCKLALLPIFCWALAFHLFNVDPFTAGIMVGVAAMPTAGTVYIVARSYNVAAMRASSSILLSTIISVMTLTIVLKWIGT